MLVDASFLRLLVLDFEQVGEVGCRVDAQIQVDAFGAVVPNG